MILDSKVTKEKIRSLMRKSFPLQSKDESCIIMVAGNTEDRKPSMVIATGNHVTGDITWVNIRWGDLKQLVHTVKSSVDSIILNSKDK